ncbi:MAG TPA: hypothetical protein VMV47_12815 [Bacteroidales bacterium]|nr:hypothetical protein [Bacteroidales bacterium]
MLRQIFFASALLLIHIFAAAQNVGNIAGDPNYFPVAVWLQNPSNADAYGSNGINMYVGIWGGLDQVKLDQLKMAGMKVICDQNEFGLKHINESTIYGWMHGDEPDNAQWNNKTKAYDPCRDPAIIISSYTELKKKDPSRPVYLNLGQDVAYINYIGRGDCRGDIDKYKVSTDGYLKGCDVASFDIYPVNNRDEETQNNLWYVAKGIDSLNSWTNRSKPVWCWIECTKISEKNPRKPTTAEVKSEVWMALIHGAKGFGYFCHSFVPPADDAAMLHDKVMLEAIKDINEQVQSLAPVLNTPDTKGFAKVFSSNNIVPVDIVTKRSGNNNYIFAVGMRCGFTTATFEVSQGNSAEVIGENRSLAITDGKFDDEFMPYSVHLYRIR